MVPVMGGHVGSLTARRVHLWPVFQPAWLLALLRDERKTNRLTGAKNMSNKQSHLNFNLHLF
jgi:hypothetical protein